jgi:hypothetical protein
MPGLKLFDEWLVPVQARSAGGTDRLLHDSNSPGDWGLWLAATGRHVREAERGFRFSHGLLALQAAAVGLGRAMVRLPLCEDTRLVGALVADPPETVPSKRAWFLEQSPRAAGPCLETVSLWLQEEAAASSLNIPTALAAQGPPGASSAS